MYEKYKNNRCVIILQLFFNKSFKYYIIKYLEREGKKVFKA